MWMQADKERGKGKHRNAEEEKANRENRKIDLTRNATVLTRSETHNAKRVD